MKCCPKGWAPVLVVTLLLQLGDAVKQPAGNLRAALQSRTEELTQQKNIAHGLELEVQELQTELAAEKKLLVEETQKEHTVSEKLNTVRSVLGLDGGSPAVVAAPAVPVVAVAQTFMAAPEVPQPAPVPVVAAPVAVIKVSKPVPQPAALMPLEEAALVPSAPEDNADFDSPEELAAQQAYGIPAEPPAPQHKPVAARAAPKVAKKAVPAQHLKVVKAATRAVREAEQAVVAASVHHARKKAVVPPQQKHQVAKPAPASAAVAPRDAAPALVTSSAVISTGGGDFDALEAQLHEEDRRIQDLDRENNLDTMSDEGGLPAAAGSTPQRSLKMQQPKLEMDAEAPMEDLLNVDAPESQGADAFPADGAVALPQVSEAVQTGLEGAESDNQFLAQFAPSAKH